MVELRSLVKLSGLGLLWVCFRVYLVYLNYLFLLDWALVLYVFYKIVHLGYQICWHIITIIFSYVFVFLCIGWNFSSFHLFYLGSLSWWVCMWDLSILFTSDLLIFFFCSFNFYFIFSSSFVYYFLLLYNL